PPLGAGGPMMAPPLGSAGGTGSPPIAPFGQPGDILDRYAGWFNDTFGSGWSNMAGGAIIAGATVTEDMMRHMANAVPGMMGGAIIGAGGAPSGGGGSWLDSYSNWFQENVPYGREWTDLASPYAHTALNWVMSDEELANASDAKLGGITL